MGHTPFGPISKIWSISFLKSVQSISCDALERCHRPMMRRRHQSQTLGAHHVGSGRPPFMYVPQSNIAGFPGLLGSAAWPCKHSNSARLGDNTSSHRTTRNVDRQLRLQRAVQDAPAADDVRAAVVCALLLAAALARQHGVVAAAWIATHRQHRTQRGRLARIKRQGGANLPGTSQQSGRRVNRALEFRLRRTHLQVLAQGHSAVLVRASLQAPLRTVEEAMQRAVLPARGIQRGGVKILDKRLLDVVTLSSAASDETRCALHGKLRCALLLVAA